MHADMLELMNEMLDGIAPPGAAERLQAHVAVCAECAGAWRALTRVHQALSEPVMLTPLAGFMIGIEKGLGYEAGDNGIRCMGRRVKGQILPRVRIAPAVTAPVARRTQTQQRVEQMFSFGKMVPVAGGTISVQQPHGE